MTDPTPDSKLPVSKKYDKFIFGWITACIISYIFIVTCTTNNWHWQKEAVAHNAAHYNVQTGAFQWNNPPTNVPPENF